MDRKAAIGDFLELGANAFVAGILVAIAFSAITLVFASTARAVTSDGENSQVRDNPPRSEAPAPAARQDAADTGALWARSPKFVPPEEGAMAIRDATPWRHRDFGVAI